MKMMLLFAGLLSNQELVPSPAEVAVWALEDAQAANDAGADVTGFRYIWIHREQEDDCIEDARVINLAPINMVLSQSGSILTTHRVNSRLMRVDLLRLGVDEVRSLSLLQTWERLADIDRYLTVDGEDLAVGVVTEGNETIRVLESTNILDDTVIVGKAKVGDTFEVFSRKEEWFGVKTSSGKLGFLRPSSVELVKAKPQPVASVTKRVIGPQCGTAGQGLADLVDSNIPIVRHDFFLRAAMQGDYVLRPVGEDGGLYYDFLQLLPARDGETDLDAFLRTFGADFDESQRLRSDLGLITTRSNVTGRARALTVIRGRAGRPGSSDGVIYGTFDSKDGDEGDINLDPLENPLDFQHQASEWIAPRANGLHAYGLFNGNFGAQRQERQDFAPDDVAVDRTVPAPHSSRLVVGMCWRCHNASEDEDGLKSIKNDFARLLSAGADIITDPESADTLASRYTSELDRVLDRSRFDFATSVVRATAVRDQNGVAVLEGMQPYEAFGRLREIYNSYWYEKVTPRTALLDLGFVYTEEDSQQAFRDIVNVRNIGEAAPIMYLAFGIPVNRWDWENVYPEVILRVQEELANTEQRTPLEKELNDENGDDVPVGNAVDGG